MYSIENLHYKFLRKANAIDSFKSRTFKIPEIDEYLNEALIIYMREVSKDLEMNVDRVNDLRQLIVFEHPLEFSKHRDGVYKAKLPVDYYKILNPRLYGVSDLCGTDKNIELYFVQYDDLQRSNDEHYKPSFYFAEANYNYEKDNIVLYTGDIIPSSVLLTYVQKHERLSNAERIGGYKLPDGTIIQQNVDLQLDSTNQVDVIVDIAVLISSIDINDVTFNVKLQKIININKL